jgi:type II secretory pathway component PulK
VAELQYVRGFEGTSLEALENVFTVRGDGGVSPDRASARVLSSVSVLSAPDIARLVTLRSASGPFRSAEQVSVLLGLAPTVAEFRELRERLSIRPGDHTVRIEGWSDVGSRTVRSRLETTLTPVNGRLAVTDLEIR